MFRISRFFDVWESSEATFANKKHGSRPKFRNEQPKAPTRKPFPRSKWESLTIIKKQHVRAFKKQKKYLPGVPIFHPIFPPFFLLRLQLLSNNFGSPTCWQGFGAWPFGSTPQNPPVSSWVSLGFPPPPSDATYVHPGYDVGTWDGRRTVGLK